MLLAGSTALPGTGGTCRAATGTIMNGREKAEQALRESEERYRILVDNLPIGIYRTTPGPQGRYLMANPAFLHMFGYASEEELLLVDASRLYMDPVQRLEISDRIMAEGSVEGVELMLRRKDGTPLWGSLRAKAVRDAASGEVLFFDCTLEDISQHKRAAEIQALLYAIANAVQAARGEHELFAALRKELRRVIDTTNFFIALCDGQGGTLTLPYFVDEQDQLAPIASGKTLTSLVIRTKKPLLVTGRDIERLIAAGEVELVGSMCKVWLGVPLEATGEVIGALVVQSYTDEAAFGPEEQEILEFVSNQIGMGITRVRAQQELCCLKEFNEGIVQCMAEGIIVQDWAGCITFVNPAAAKMLDYEADELAGRPWATIVPDDGQPPPVTAHEEGQHGLSDRYEMHLARKDGSRFPVLVSSSPLHDADSSSFLGTIAVFADISERAAAVDALARHAREMAALYATSLEMNSQHDLAALLQAIVERASSLLNANMGALYLLRPDGHSLEVVVGHNLDPDLIGVILPLGEGLSGRVAQAGEPTMVDDYRRWPGRARIYEGLPFLRVLAVPLRIGDQAIGVINVTDSQRTGSFDEDQVRLVSLFADQASLAVQKARLFEAEERQRREAETLYSATQALSTSLDLQQVLRLILSELRQVVPYDSASVQQIRPDGRCEVIGGHGFANLEAVVGISFDLDAEDNPNGQVVRQRAALILHDAPTLYGEFNREPHTQAAVRSWLGVPLLFGDETIGMIALGKKEPGFYTEEHARLAQAFAAQAATAMENARLFEAEREQRELAEALRQATAAVSSTLDLDQMLDCILEQVDRVIPNDAVNINLLFREDECRIVRSRGYERLGSNVNGVSLGLANTPTFRTMVATGESLVLTHTGGNSDWIRMPGIEWVRSYAGAPIKARDRVIGFLNVDSGTPGFYTQAHAHRLQAFADQVSLALANAQSFATVEQARRDWEATFDAMQDPIAVIDAGRRIRRANQAYADLVGSPPEQVAGRQYDELFPREACPARPCPLERVLVHGKPATCIHSRGDRVFEVQATPVQAGSDDSGSPVSAIYAMRDITERKRAEEEIHRRNWELAFLNRVIAISARHEAVETILQAVCQEMVAAFGAPRAAAVLLNAGTGKAIVAAESLRTSGQALLGTSTPVAATPPGTGGRAGGDQQPLAVPALSWPRTTSQLLAPLEIEGTVAGYLEVDDDRDRRFLPEEIALAQRVADQVAGAVARARLEEVQRRLTAAIEQAADGVVISDVDNAILYANPSFERITGYSRVDAIGKKPIFVHGQNSGWEVHLARWRNSSSNEPLQRRVSHRRPDGTSYVVDLTLVPVRNAAGDLVNLVMTMRDVTREVQLEQQFRQAQKLDSLGQLAGGIAHDFNNLLTVLHLSSRMLERQLRPEDPLWEHVQHIRQTGDRAAKLTKQLLSFSRREVTDPQVLSLNQAVGDLSRMLQRIIGEDIELRLELAPDSWLVKADPAQIEQVIMNLAINARDAMPTGGTLTISTANVNLDEHYVALHVDARPGEHVLLTIGDTGEGMNDEVKSHLFEPFFTTKGRGQGTGLGLSTVFGIVKQSNGHIEVESQPGKGARFLIYLPRTIAERAVDRSAAEPVDVSASVSGPSPGKDKATILVVEDDAAVRGLATRVLRTFGYRVLEADDGARAQEILEALEGNVDLLVTDMVMPRIGGPELAERLQRQRPGTPVLYISGYADGTLPPLPAPTSFLPKPFNVEDLLRLVQSMLGGPA